MAVSGAAITAHQGAVKGMSGKAWPMATWPSLPTIRPSAAPPSASIAASVKKAARICAPVAPSALSRPISRRRCVTAMSMTFMMRMPATPRLMAAMPPTASVRARRMRSKVASTASWVIAVMSRSPSWRRRMISSISALARGICSRLFASTKMRNSASVLNSACAEATGTTTISSVLKPSEAPCRASTPMMRKRRSPMRSHSPRTCRGPNSSLATLAPMTHTGWLWWGSPGGRKRPWAMSIWRTWMNSAVVPSTGVSRVRFPTRTSPAPMMSGAKRRMALLRFSARASSMVMSRGVLPMSTPGVAPAVSERPGRTMMRLVPSEPN